MCHQVIMCIHKQSALQKLGQCTIVQPGSDYIQLKGSVDEGHFTECMSQRVALNSVLVLQC